MTCWSRQAQSAGQWHDAVRSSRLQSGIPLAINDAAMRAFTLSALPNGRAIAADANGKLTRMLDICSDISERERAEDARWRLNCELRAISSCHQTLMRAVDEQTLLDDICRIACDEAGYRMVWVGFAEDDDAKTVRPVASAGFDDGYLEQARDHLG